METIHIVQPFDRAKRGVMPRLALQFQSAGTATARAEAMAESCAGIVAYSMDVDEDGGDYSAPLVLFTAGEVPELG